MMVLRHTVRFVTIVRVLVVGYERKCLVGTNGLPPLRRVVHATGLYLGVAFERAGQALARNGLAATGIQHLQHHARLIIAEDPKGCAVILLAVANPQLIARGTVSERGNIVGIIIIHSVSNH